MILLCWRRNYTSELDKHKLVETIGQLIPIILESHKAIAAVSKNIKVETQLILEQGAVAMPRERNKATARTQDPEVLCSPILTNRTSGVKNSGGEKNV